MKYSVIQIVCQLNTKLSFYHGRIIKWTQQIGFLTLVETSPAVELNHGNDSIKSLQEFCIYRNSVKFHQSL